MLKNSVARIRFRGTGQVSRRILPGLCFWIGSLQLGPALIFDPTPEDGYKMKSYGLVVTKAPGQSTRGKDGKIRFPEEARRVLTWKSDTDWKRVSRFVVQGPEITPEIETTNGVKTVVFGADLSVSTHSMTDGVWKLQWQNKGEIPPEKATWRIGSRSGALEVPPISGRDKTFGTTKLRITDDGEVEFIADDVLPEKGIDKAGLSWEFFVRETTLSYDKDRKLIERRMRDYKVSEWHEWQTNNIPVEKTIAATGGGTIKYLSRSEENKPAPHKVLVIKYDGEVKVASRQDGLAKENEGNSTGEGERSQERADSDEARRSDPDK